MLEDLRTKVCQANLELKRQNMVIYTWGNVSGIDRQKQIIAIKPSGISYDELTSDKIVLLDFEGNIVDGKLKPSSDAATHLELYRNFKDIGGICHSHSPNATMWAQACKDIPCFGTTHADYFYGSIPVTDKMTDEEIKKDYELNTGKVIVRRFMNIDPLQIPSVLVANHGPFSWGKAPESAVENAVVLEQIASIAQGTININPDQNDISKTLLDKHYLRKHGKDAYYGQG